MSGKNKLECIQIGFMVFSDYEPNNECHRLEEILIQSGWPELKRVSIFITFLGQSGAATSEWALGLDTRFLRLRKKKTVGLHLSRSGSHSNDRHFRWVETISNGARCNAFWNWNLNGLLILREIHMPQPSFSISSFKRLFHTLFGVNITIFQVKDRMVILGRFVLESLTLRC